MGLVLGSATHNHPIGNVPSRSFKTTRPGEAATQRREAAINGEVALWIRIEIDIPIPAYGSVCSG